MTASDDMRGRSPGQVEEYRRSSMTAAADAMGELAYGTGGRFFHNTNNLEAGFNAITEAPEVAYMLELPLEGVRVNGSYHRLKVKMDREGMAVQARRGYFMPKPEKRKNYKTCSPLRVRECRGNIEFRENGLPFRYC